jgi:hypothetical protein
MLELALHYRHERVGMHDVLARVCVFDVQYERCWQQAGVFILRPARPP